MLKNGMKMNEMKKSKKKKNIVYNQQSSTDRSAGCVSGWEKGKTSGPTTTAVETKKNEKEKNK